jgi:hypothetical protein
MALWPVPYGRPLWRPLDFVQLGVAHAAGRDLDHNFAAADSGLGHAAQNERPRVAVQFDDLIQNHGLHCRSSSDKPD